MKKKIIYAIMLSALFGVTATGCGKNDTAEESPKTYTLTTLYTIDGQAVDSLPSGQFYDYTGITTDSDAEVTWDITSWSPVTTELQADTTCTVDFTATKSPFKMNNTGYLTLQSAFDAVAAGTPAVIDCTSDYSGYAVSTEGTEITLNLNGHTIDGVGNDTISNLGIMHIIGEGTLTNSVVSSTSKSLINYGTLDLTDVKMTNQTTNITIWNSNNGSSVMNLTNCEITHEVAASNVIINSGTMNIYSGIYYASSEEGYAVIKLNVPEAILNYYDGSVTNDGAGFAFAVTDGTLNNYSENIIENGFNLGDSANPIALPTDSAVDGADDGSADEAADGADDGSLENLQ